MMTVRRAETRGHADHGWLNAHHSFSFAGYHDPERMHVGPLRVLNDDRIDGGQGFPAHGHRDMEIVTYVLDGKLSHRDSMGNGSTIGPGDVQRMSAGTGVTHSEFNASPTDPLHLLQIWLIPTRAGLAPGYEEKRFDRADKQGRLRAIATPDGRDGSVTVRSDASIHATWLNDGEVVRFTPSPDRTVYVHVAQGAVRVNGEPLKAGDAALLEQEAEVVLDQGVDADVLLFDLGALR